jgi:hypothetical protein
MTLLGFTLPPDSGEKLTLGKYIKKRISNNFIRGFSGAFYFKVQKTMRHSVYKIGNIARWAYRNTQRSRACPEMFY